MFSLLIAYVIHKPRRTLSEFLRFFWELYGSKVKLAPFTEISSIGSLTPKSPIRCYFFKYYWLILKKNAYFDRNLLHFNGTGMARKQPFEGFFEKWMVWVVSFLGLNAFLPIWVLFALDFCCYITSSGCRNKKF